MIEIMEAIVRHFMNVQVQLPMIEKVGHTDGQRILKPRKFGFNVQIW